MKIKKLINVCKGFAVIQAVTAPTLMMIGHFTGNTKMRNFGAIWCGAVVLDTARVTFDSLDRTYKYEI